MLIASPDLQSFELKFAGLEATPDLIKNLFRLRLRREVLILMLSSALGDGAVAVVSGSERRGYALKCIARMCVTRGNIAHSLIATYLYEVMIHKSFNIKTGSKTQNLNKRKQCHSMFRR